MGLTLLGSRFWVPASPGSQATGTGHMTFPVVARAVRSAGVLCRSHRGPVNLNPLQRSGQWSGMFQRKSSLTLRVCGASEGRRSSRGMR